MTTSNYHPNDYELFIGIDTDKKSFVFTVKDHYNMNINKKIPSNPKLFYNYITKNFINKKIICGYEAGPTGYHLYDYLNENNIPCVVIPPASIPKASSERVKNNRIDSEKIGDTLMSKRLNTIRVPEGIYRELRHLTNIRENYAYMRKAAKQRIKALLLYTNLHNAIRDSDNNWSNRYIKELKNLECSPAVRSRLNMLLDDLEYAREKILSTHKMLKTFRKDNPEIDRYMNYLTSIPGIGFVAAITLLGKIGNPENLKSPRELSSFVGLVPCEKSTGDTINKTSITHMGSQTLRFMLVEASWIAIRRDTQLMQFFHRIKNKNNPKAASKIAITAVARKLTQIIYRVLKDQRSYIAH